MEYMESKVQDIIEGGISENQRLYKEIDELSWVEDAIVILEAGTEPEVGDLIAYNYNGIRYDGTLAESYCSVMASDLPLPACCRLHRIIERNGKPVVYKPQRVSQGGE